MLCYNISRMSETIGDKLKQAREARLLTLDQAAQTTRIRPRYLEALERGDLSAIPSNAQARGFLRIYADFLGLDPNSLAPVKAPEPAASTPDASTALSTDLQPAPALKTVQQPPPPRPNLLTSLRERFTRRAKSEDAALVEESRSAAEIQPPAPEPEPFVPARYTEELPAEPAPAVQEPAPPQTPAPTVPRRKTTSRKASGTKPAAKRIKFLDSIEEGNTEQVKKKLTDAPPSQPRMKRG